MKYWSDASFQLDSTPVFAPASDIYHVFPANIKPDSSSTCTTADYEFIEHACAGWLRSEGWVRAAGALMWWWTLSAEGNKGGALTLWPSSGAELIKRCQSYHRCKWRRHLWSSSDDEPDIPLQLQLLGLSLWFEPRPDWVCIWGEFIFMLPPHTDKQRQSASVSGRYSSE